MTNLLNLVLLAMYSIVYRKDLHGGDGRGEYNGGSVSGRDLGPDRERHVYFLSQRRAFAVVATQGQYREALFAEVEWLILPKNHEAPWTTVQLSIRDGTVSISKSVTLFVSMRLPSGHLTGRVGLNGCVRASL